MLRLGSIVKIKGSKNKGIVLDTKENSASISINNHVLSYALSDLEEEDLLLIDRISNYEVDQALDFVLSIDAFRLLDEYRFNPYVLASSTKINIFPHQIDEVVKILDNPRMMIADEVGLGKTIIAALVATELRERGIANKILFVVPKSLVIKWQEELRNRFETVTEHINSDYLRMKDDPFKRELFCYVTSMDFLKQQRIMRMMEDCDFDLIVVDEAHKLAYGTERFTLGALLARRSNFLLFLTATPHNGDDEDFLQRMRLLDPYFHQLSTTSHLMTRNIKEDVIDLDGKEVFPPRTSKTIDIDLGERELRIHKMVDDYINERLEEASSPEERNMIRFLTTIIRKRASSSFYALKNTLGKRKEKLGTTKNIRNTIREFKRNEEDNDEEASERNEEEVIGFSTGSIPKEREEISYILMELEDLQKTDSKLQLLVNFINTTKKNDPNAKMVVFSEYRDTMNYVRASLAEQYKVGSIDGTMNIQERNEALLRFRDSNGSDIMVCTDAAGEGIDMQFCNIEINYDLPWNPNKLEQRMGRIHRIGQDRNVYYYNFVINGTIDGYIIRKLLDKIENIKKSIGEKIYDVIGKRLVNEEEIANLYEELLKLPKENWEAKTMRVEGIIEEKERILTQINELLLGYRLDRTKLEDIKRNIRNVLDKDEVKRFVEKYLGSNGGKLEAIYEEEDVYRIFLPKQIPIPMGGGTRVLEGSFRSDIAIKKGYTYFDLGNPYIMSLVHHAAKPSVTILKHPDSKDILLIYKIMVRDRKGRERNGKMFAFNFDSSTGNVKEVDMRDIWSYEFSLNYTRPYDKSSIIENKELVDVYADKCANDLIQETAPRLADIEYKTEESIWRYYSRQIEEIKDKIDGYNQRITESPRFSTLKQKEETNRTKLQNELKTKLEQTKRDFEIIPEIELVGIAIIDNDTTTSDIKKRLERPGFVPKISDFSRLNQQINSENSETTHRRMQENPEEWIQYHRSYREARKEWKVVPYERMIERIIEISPRLKVGDFGCGEAKIMEILGENRVFSCDHVSINDKVIACDMKTVPLDEGSLDVVVFSLSLMGKNWVDYILEARRCLWYGGSLLIAETTNALSEGRLSDLLNVLKDHNFEIIKKEEIEVFTFIEAVKR